MKMTIEALLLITFYPGNVPRKYRGLLDPWEASQILDVLESEMFKGHVSENYKEDRKRK